MPPTKPQVPRHSPKVPPALCVSIHDVAPGTWSDCLVLLKAVREVAPRMPLTWLVVPHYHGRLAPARDSLAMESALTQLLSEGHELALHGYTHVDTAPPERGLRDYFVRSVYTRGEGEFAAISQADALQRLDLGLAWFAKRGWPVAGFVPPAWLTSAGACQAVRQRPFIYTTSMSRFYLLPGRRSLWSPSLMYTARQAAGRWLSPPADNALALAMRLAGSPLLRLALHPADARHPRLVRHAQHLIDQLLRQRTPMTKQTFATAAGAGAGPPPGRQDGGYDGVDTHASLAPPRPDRETLDADGR